MIRNQKIYSLQQKKTILCEEVSVLEQPEE